VHSLSPFGGREPALSELLGPNAELVARFRRFAAARRPGLVLVVGPAGSGRGLVLRALAQEILPERTKGDTDASLADPLRRGAR
jgi:type II secretory ATPase GspE/PulE/Tfp pilus assembly ATPase PilB-like protein